MGTDDLFSKRKAKSAKQLARKKASRASYDRVLIVCEGSKTEPNYFCGLINDLEINSANVEIDGDCDSSPGRIVEYAKRLYTAEKKTGDGYDKVFCVFDKDSHQSYDTALRSIQALSPNGVFIAINSVPCFEFWLLLHYVFTTKPFMADGKGSSCASVIVELKKYLADYEKGDNDIYAEVAGQTEQAIAYSKRVLAQAEESNTDNPSTLLHVLVEFLQNIKIIKDV